MNKHSLLLHVLVGFFLLIQQQSSVSALVAGAADSPPPACRGLSCMRLRGGFLGMGRKKEEPPQPEPFPIGKLFQASLAAVATAGLATIDPADLREPTLLGLERWQLLVAGSYAVFSLANTFPGRLDTVIGRPKAMDRRFFTPAGWAFAIWGPIFLGEMLLAFSVFFPKSLAPAGSAWLAQLAPFYASASLFQAIWCFCFRPWALPHLWIPASLLTFAAGGQFFASQFVSAAVFGAGDITLWGKIVCWVPMSLHFGWLVAAASLSWNSFLSQSKVEDGVRLTVAIATSYAAWALLGLVSVSRSDPLPSLTASWALWAVSKGHSVLKGVVDDLALAALNNSAALAALLSLLTAACVAVAPAVS